jgi:AcrR family transcriptional regulator
MIGVASSPLTMRTTECFSGKTRDRILQASLVLFNSRSFQTVTTAMIAKQAEILEGTLWYHFPSKKDILCAHVDLLKSLFAEENTSASIVAVEPVIQGVFKSYDIIWDFRYILRDDFSMALKNEPDALLLAQGVNAFLDQWTMGRVMHSSQCGILSLHRSRVEDTAELILLIGRYWLDFSSKKYPEANQNTLRQKGLSHLFNVLEPYLNEPAKETVLCLLNA